MNTHKKRATALNYFGGKSRYLDWILPVLNTPHAGYLEPYMGGASVALNMPQASIEVVNDIDGRVTNFFTQLRDNSDKLIGLLQMTPYSRVEFMDCLGLDEITDPVEQARQFFVRSMQSFAGICDTKGRIRSWRAATSSSRRGIALETSKWYSKIDGLERVVNRLQCMIIENKPAFELIEAYGQFPDWLIYCDPPYRNAVRTSYKDYAHEIDDNHHVALARRLHQCKAKVAISHYDDPEYDELYTGWYKNYSPLRSTNLGKSKKKQEIIYTNYKRASHGPQGKLDLIHL